MGLFDFLFSSGVSNSQKKAHRNAGNNTSSGHENYARGYEDGYDDCCCDHDCSYDDYHDRGYCDRDEYEGIENDECYDDNCGWQSPFENGFFTLLYYKVMKKTAILLSATMAFAINSNAQSMQSGYKGHVEAGYSVGIGDYDFGRFEVNTTHGYQVNPYIFFGAGTGLHFMSSYKTGDMEIPLDVRDSKVDIPIFANFRSNFTKGKLSPFFDIKGGTFVSNNGGLYVVASLGVRYALNSKQGLNLSVGYAAEKLEFETFERFNGRYDMSYTRKPATYDTESVSVKLGFDF